MRTERSQEILSALTPDTLAERQRVVDTAVRAARNSGYCDTFNSMIALVFPEMMVTFEGYTVALDSDGRTCGQGSGTQTFWAWASGERDASPVGYNAQGYDVNGYDRDGFDRHGYDQQGYDANDHGRAYQRLQRRTRWTDEAGEEQHQEEQVYTTGYGRYSGRDAEGNLRVGRGPTEDELAIEEAARAEQARRAAGRYNPTTWKPTPAEVPATSEEVPVTA